MHTKDQGISDSTLLEPKFHLFIPDQRELSLEWKGVECGGCVTCQYVRPGKKIKATATKYSVDINKAVDCKTKNVNYCIDCSKPGCQQQYIGQTHKR